MFKRLSMRLRSQVLRNVGDEKYPDFKAERAFIDKKPPPMSRVPIDQVKYSNTLILIAATRSTDWHELEQHRFVGRAAAAFEQLARERLLSKLDSLRRRWLF
jgi:hypothetical protein